MGSILSSLFGSATRDWRVVMIGLDSAGKTTILYRLRIGEVIHTTPTIGFNVEAIEYKRLKLTVWDVGGQSRIRPLWQHYMRGADAIIFVVDSTDRERLEEAKDELHSLVRSPEAAKSPLLVYANKQDAPGALNADAVRDALAVEALGKDRPAAVFAASATQGVGLHEGLDWLARTLKV
eukprot:m51a1_g2238 putative adp-ribosylation factor 1 (179) ;mRNA; f:277386-278016